MHQDGTKSVACGIGHEERTGVPDVVCRVARPGRGIIPARHDRGPLFGQGRGTVGLDVPVQRGYRELLRFFASHA